jgi:protein-tyrosine phosphatase
MMVDYDWINERLALGGGVTTVEDAQQLANAGITDVVDMRAEFDDHQIFTSQNVSVLWLPQNDDGTPRSPAQVLAGIQFTLSALATMGRKVYIHCAAGINRGPTEMYAVLRSMGWPKTRAIAMITTVRPQVQFQNQPNYVNSVDAVIAQSSKAANAVKCTVM